MPRSIHLKQKALLDKIQQAKSDLQILKKKRKIEVGELAHKYGLTNFEDSILKHAFEKLAKELLHENS